jgi:hypothetical protein
MPQLTDLPLVGFFELAILENINEERGYRIVLYYPEVILF